MLEEKIKSDDEKKMMKLREYYGKIIISIWHYDLMTSSTRIPHTCTILVTCQNQFQSFA